MKNFLSLRILDVFQGLFKLFGIDYRMMRKILRLKLTMDQRRVPTIFNQSKKKKEEEEQSNHFLKSLGIYALYGLILIPFLVMGDNYLFQMSLVFGMSMFILMTSMISDFSTVLLDVRDKTILNTKPIDKRTVSVAKVVHVSIYMIQLTGAFALIPLIVSIATKGILFALLFVIQLIFLVLFIIVLTALIYILILRFFDGERLKDIINYVQILLSLGVVVGYQILARSFEFVDFQMKMNLEWWHVFIPPVWFSAPFELVLHNNYANNIVFYFILSFVIPILSVVLYSYLVPSFERNLEKLLYTGGENKKKTNHIDNWLAKLICRKKEERVFFTFATQMMKQEREFKLKVYPTLGISLVFPFIFLFNYLSTGTFSEMRESKIYLMMYFCNLMVPSVIHMLKYSGKYKGAWIYRVTPIRQPEQIYSATMKAFLMKLYIPVVTVVSIIFIFIFSVRIIPDVIAMLLTGLIVSTLASKVMNNDVYPFSQSFEFSQSTNTGYIFLLMFIAGVFGGIHYLITLVNFGVYMYIAVLIIMLWISWKLVFKKRLIHN
ncbi:hypothetical protein [Aquibacillus kalidii]|uniref:hypothetical protein n=1 Tax=Aquibacillus kalidii TaxID=2762597 RepID=UPI00164634CD|nr:hypothetical protein [Aquibacillus kalidii]